MLFSKANRRITYQAQLASNKQENDKYLFVFVFLVIFGGLILIDAPRITQTIQSVDYEAFILGCLQIVGLMSLTIGLIWFVRRRRIRSSNINTDHKRINLELLENCKTGRRVFIEIRLHPNQRLDNIQIDTRFTQQLFYTSGQRKQHRRPPDVTILDCRHD